MNSQEEMRWIVIDLLREHHPDIIEEVGNSILAESAMRDDEFIAGDTKLCQPDACLMLDGIRKLAEDGLIVTTKSVNGLKVGDTRWEAA